MKLRVLDRYLIKEVAQAWLAVTLVLVAVLMTNRLARFLSEAASGEIAGDMVFTLLGLKALAYLGLVLPASFFLAMVLAFGRLYRDSEMAAFTAVGVGPGKLYRGLYLLAVPLALLSAYLSLSVAPWANRIGADVEAQARQSLDLEGLRPGRFMTTDDAAGMFYFEGITPDGRLRDVFIQTDQNGDLVVIGAEFARQQTSPETGERHLVLEDGVRYQGSPGQADWRLIEFEEHGIRLPDQAVAVANLRRDALPTEVLWAAGEPADLAELQWRLSMPLMALILTLIAVPLSRAEPRSGRYGKLLAAVLIYVGYSNFLSASQDWVRQGALPPVLGLWWVHGAMLLIGVLMLVLRFHLWRGRVRRGR